MSARMHTALTVVTLLAVVAATAPAPNPQLTPANQAMLDGFAVVGNGCGTVIRTWAEGPSRRCYVLTSWHVIEEFNSGEIPIAFPKFNRKGVRMLGKPAEFRAREVASNRTLDYAILSAECPPDQVTARCADRTRIWNLKLLDEVCAIGRPCKEAVWATKGNVASFNRSLLDDSPDNDGTVIGHSAPTSFGNSGGPLFAASGEQIGINVNVGKTLTEILDYADRTIGHCAAPVEHVSLALSLEAVYMDLGKSRTLAFFGVDLNR